MAFGQLLSNLRRQVKGRFIRVRLDLVGRLSNMVGGETCEIVSQKGAKVHSFNSLSNQASMIIQIMNQESPET